MASGSGGAQGGNWQTVCREKGENKRVASSEGPEMSGDEGNKVRRTGANEEFVVLFKVKGANQGDPGFKAINPLKVTNTLENQIGRDFQAKILYNGMLRVCCKNKKQYNDARAVGKLVVKVESLVPKGSQQGLRGVVYGVFAGLSEKEILENVKGGQVTEVLRFRRREGADGDPPVLLTFTDNVLPQRVFLGSMAYQVREYIRPPLRCYNCQQFRPVAGSCRGKRKCAKCGGDHVIQNCEAEAPKCPNCGGDHAAAFRGCMHSVQARRVQAVRENDKVSYAEAVQRVARERTDCTAREGAVMGSQRNVPKLPSDMLIFNKESFLAFVTDVLVGAQKADRSLIANGQELKRFVKKFKEVPDLICIQETWLKPCLDFVIPGYECLRLDRSDRSGGGCATFVKNGLQYRKVDVYSCSECLAVEVWSSHNFITAKLL